MRTNVIVLNATPLSQRVDIELNPLALRAAADVFCKYVTHCFVYKRTYSYDDLKLHANDHYLELADQGYLGNVLDEHGQPITGGGWYEYFIECIDIFSNNLLGEMAMALNAIPRELIIRDVRLGKITRDCVFMLVSVVYTLPPPQVTTHEFQRYS